MTAQDSQNPAIAYTFDRNYAPYAAVSMATAQKHSRVPLQFYCLHPHDQPECAAVFRQLQARGFLIKFVPVNLSMFDGWMNLPRFGAATYLRLLIPSLIPDDVVLYLDPDTVVYKDLAPLLRTAMGDAMIAAAIDNDPLLHPVSSMITDTYINTGVILFNKKAFKPDYFEHLTAMQVRHHQDLRMPDQCLLNLFANGRKVVLRSRWNWIFQMHSLTVSKWTSDLKKSGVSIGHYAVTPKPWCQWAHPEVAAHWWGLVKEHRLTDIPMVPITRLDQLEQLAALHDLNREYRFASSVKSTVLEQLKGLVLQRAA